ncbi:MAG: phosphatidate cytidylyltransferase [Anaerolineales bacterium]|jgi:phosphatidate cytidylyltransferase
MLRQRALVVIALLPIGLVLIYLGGWAFSTLVMLILGLAAWEYGRLFKSGGFQPADVLLIGGTVLLAFGRAWNGFASADWILGLLVLASMTYHLLAYERGRDQAASDFAITLSGILYLGWLGAYLISLRQLPNGMWWILLVLPSVWLADSGAYFVGRAIGKHKFSPRLSPKKTWEGFFGGIVFGVLGGALLAYILNLFEPGVITPLQGLITGLLLALITPLGDLGESMVKRQFGIKDSSNLIPGHGGVFDRIDSWLWAGVIGYYLILWLFL